MSFVNGIYDHLLASSLQYVDFIVGADSGYICFEEPEAAVRARAVSEFVEGRFNSKNCIVFLEAVTGKRQYFYFVCLSGGFQFRRNYLSMDLFL